MMDCGEPGKTWRIPGYELIEMVAEDDTAALFRARQLAEGRLVALTAYRARAHAGGPQGEELLRRARTTARLSHPHIVESLDCGCVEGVPYVATEWVEGETVSALIHRLGWLSETQALCILSDVVKALKHAAERAVVHGDIRPSSILVIRSAGAKLAYVGLLPGPAALRASSRDPLQLGAPHYASPERIRGQLLDIRADIYSLGAVLYHMLTGSPPFEAPTAGAVLEKCVTESIPSPQAAQPALSDAVCRLVPWMADRDRDRRPADPSALGDAIGQVILGKMPPTMRPRPAAAIAAPAGPMRLPRPAPKRKPSGRAAAASWVVTILLIVVSNAALYCWWSPWLKEDHQAGEAFDSAMRYAASNPADRTGILARLTSVVAEHPASRYARWAKEQIGKLEASPPRNAGPDGKAPSGASPRR
jgi:serine/threonine-protein kinase